MNLSSDIKFGKQSQASSTVAFKKQKDMNRTTIGPKKTLGLIMEEEAEPS